MALTATCIDKIVQFQDDDQYTSFPIDSLVDIVVVDGGASSTITVRRLHANAMMTGYVFTGTDTECLGIQTPFVTCLRDMLTATGYADWAYP